MVSIIFVFRSFQIVFDGSRSICHRCWQRIDYGVRHPTVQEARPIESFDVSGLTRAANTSRRCMIDNCRNLELRSVSDTIKAYLLSYYRFYIPPLARICQYHLRNMSWEDFSENVTRRQDSFRGENIHDIIEIYTNILEKKGQLDFENLDELCPDTLQFWAGVSHQQFNAIFDETPSLQEYSNGKTMLGIYLCKLRSGEPNRRLMSVFGLPRSTIQLKIKQARDCLENEFLPLHLGFDHITRDEVIARNRILPNNIFGTQDHTRAIIILDGTYLFVQKSSNFLFQCESYSLHKYDNLIKPFMIVCGDGYILEVTGPYNARTSDAEILRQVLDNHTDHMEDAPIRWFLETDDVMVVDRGFRDSLSYAEECGFTVCAPQSLGRHERQLSTEAANKSRLVTLVRWVVETVNGKIKRDFKIFRHRYFNNTLPNAIVDFRIAAALVNATQESYRDNRLTESFSEMIERNMNRPNLLADYVDQQRLNIQRNISFQRMEATLNDLVDFPRMTYDELLTFAIGTYHVKLAKSYCYEHIRGTDVYSIEIYRHPERINFNDDEENSLIRCRIKSRHVQRRTYYCYVAYGRHEISAYCCSCIHGRRTLGSCAHIMSIIYYLAWARHEGDLVQPAGFLDAVCLDVENT